MKKWLKLSLLAIVAVGLLAGLAVFIRYEIHWHSTEPFPEAEFLYLSYNAHTEEDSHDWIFLHWEPEYFSCNWHWGENDPIQVSGDVPEEFRAALDEAWARAKPHLIVLHDYPSGSEWPELEVTVRYDDDTDDILSCRLDTEGVPEFLDLLYQAALAQAQAAEGIDVVEVTGDVFTESIPAS